MHTGQHEGWLSQIFYNFYHFLDAIHEGSIFAQAHSLCGITPRLYKNCGGKISIHHPTTPKGEQVVDWSQALFTCNGLGCNMRLSCLVAQDEWINLLLHLMLKQMHPGLKTLNYLHCAATPERRVAHQDMWQTIREVGTISLSGAVFHGLVQNEFFTPDLSYNFHLGYTVLPGVNTSEGHDGLDKWFNFLVEKKMAMVEEWVKKGFPTVLGPKPMST